MNNETYKYLKFWQQKIDEKPPISQTIKIYKPKYKWQKILPFWMLKLFVKPTIFYDCFPKAIDSVCDGEVNLTFSVKMNF